MGSDLMPTEIIPNLFLGDRADSESFVGTVVCVQHEQTPTKPSHIWMPLLRNEERAYLSQLDSTAAIIDGWLSAGPVLVHCGGGIDRAPLVVVWFLHRRRGLVLDDAYDLVKKRRPQINRHEDWIIR